MAVSGGENYTVTYTYGKNNRLLQDEKAEGETNEFCYYRYDPNGNQLQRERETYSPIGTAAKKSAGFHEDLAAFEKREYNGLNQLVYVFAGNVRTDYAYRPDGLRHSKEAGVLTTHLWDGRNMAAEAHANGIFARYIRGMNLIARRQDNLNQYYHFNAHGDVVLRTDQSGTALKSYEYDAFGVEKNPEKLDANPWRYCGEYYDKELEEYYLRNRYYNPRLGRFTSEDVARAGLNWYTYCENNPVMFVDPLGLAVDIVSILELVEQIILGLGALYATYELATNSDEGWDDGTAARPLPELKGEVIPFPTPPPEDDKEPYHWPVTDAVPDFDEVEDEPIYIYRTGSGNNTNLSPRQWEPGLSYQFTKPVDENYTRTTLQAINRTGVLVAVPDKPNHISICPIDDTQLQNWKDSRPVPGEPAPRPHEYTLLIRSLSTKHDRRGGVVPWKD